MKCAGDWQTVTPGHIRQEAMRLLSDYERRVSESDELKRIVSRTGAENVADKLLSVMAANCSK